MEHILDLVARTAIALIQVLPIRWVARPVHRGGAVAVFRSVYF